MIDIAILRAMVAAGASAQMLLAAIEADCQSDNNKLLIRRKKDAARQQRYRQRNVMSRNVTLPVCDPPHAYTSPPVSKSSEPKKVLRSMRVIPSDWVPDREFAKSKGWSESKIEEESGRFKDHALAKDRKCKDWDAAWRNWVTSPYQSQNGVGNGQGRSVLEAGRRIDAHLKALGATDDYVPGSSGPKPLDLDKPMRPVGFRLISKG